MKENRSAFYINVEYVDKSAILKGLRWLDELGKLNPNKRSALLAVDQLSILNGVLSDLLGESAIGRLKKEKKLRISSNSTVTLLILRQKPLYSWNGPVLAVHPSRALLDKIDDLYGVTDVLVIPWRLDEVKPWINTWRVPELRVSPTSSPISPKFSNPEVEVRLKEISHMNSGDNFGHPNDHKRIVQIFRDFRKRKVNYDPEEIRAWMIREGGCDSEAADVVKKIAADILAGKKIR